jgi:RimJ/RimL family protein N-acetyltransferase
LPDRIEAYTEIGNIAERRALEGSGFELEGTLRHASFRGGEWHDGVLYSIIRDDARVPPGQVVDDTTRVIPS